MKSELLKIRESPHGKKKKKFAPGRSVIEDASKMLILPPTTDKDKTWNYRTFYDGTHYRVVEVVYLSDGKIETITTPKFTIKSTGMKQVRDKTWELIMSVPAVRKYTKELIISMRKPILLMNSDEKITERPWPKFMP